MLHTTSMGRPDFDVVIVGGGVVGLACAVHAGASGREVLLIERHVRCGQECSSRNSGVIHAGLYYAPASLKARLCVQGRELLYARCARHGIAHAQCGKLIVASSESERGQLQVLLQRGLDNGAGDLRLVEQAELRALEPRVQALAALWSPRTGIVDVHGLMDSYRADAHDAGAVFAMRTGVTKLTSAGGAWRVETRDDDGRVQAVDCGRVVNAGGLRADRIAAMAGVDVDAAGLRQRYCRGDYFALSPALGKLTQHLVYPLPGAAGLGIHVTFDTGGQFSAGPDAQYVDDIDYRVDGGKQAAFAAALRRYLPEVRDADLTPGYVGVRPKLQGPGEPFRDFVVEDAAVHGLPGLINLVGIESPGLTASEAIALRVRELLG